MRCALNVAECLALVAAVERDGANSVCRVVGCSPHTLRAALRGRTLQGTTATALRAMVLREAAA